MSVTRLQRQKSELRKLARARRDRQEHRTELSRRIAGAFMALPEYATAATVMFYVGVRSEVQTRTDLEAALECGPKIVVPWCSARGELELFHLQEMQELETGSFGIPEPRGELRQQAERQIRVEDVDVIMVPGVAFDPRGARIGHGRGYYDRLLGRARPETPFIALAFECQMFDEIPAGPQDVFMDKVITEDRIYHGPVRH